MSVNAMFLTGKISSQSQPESIILSACERTVQSQLSEKMRKFLGMFLSGKTLLQYQREAGILSA